MLDKPNNFYVNEILISMLYIFTSSEIISPQINHILGLLEF